MSDPITPPVTPPAAPPVNPPTPPVAPAVEPEITPELQRKIEGKSNQEIVKMYGELERKMGEASTNIEQRDQLIKQMNVVLAAIGKNPDREKMVKAWIKEVSEGSDGEDKKEENIETIKVNDTRKALENDIIRKFEGRYGLDKMAGEEKKGAHMKIGQALWDLVDPEGKYKSYDEMMDHVPLQKLDKMLENAYWISNRDIISEKVRLQDEAKRREANGGAIGSISSVNIGQSDEITMSTEEIKAAEKLGISKEKWIERKKQIAKGV